MWRAFFLAIGVYMILFGLQCMTVDRVVLKFHDAPPAANGLGEAKAGPQKQFVPAAWVPWSLMSSGAVVCLYSFTIPRRVAGK
jgi:hypothetical protein